MAYHCHHICIRQQVKHVYHCKLQHLRDAHRELHKEFRIPKIDYGYVARIPTTKPLDYGSVLNSEPFGEDYGFVKDAVKGKWYQWWTWDRPKNLYPTNHVKIELKMGIGADSEKTLEEFKYKFYKLD